MKKFITILFILPLAYTVVSQNNRTVVIRPETYREKQEREMRDVVEFFNDLGSLFGSTPEQRKAYLTEVKNSKYSTFVAKELEEWKKKGEFEKTVDWQKRLTDSTAIKKVEIQEFGINKFARELRVLDQSFYHRVYLLNTWFYDNNGKYDADKEALIINTFWGKIPIPIPITEAKNMSTYIRYLNPRFFIYNDQLALLSLSLYDHGEYDEYTWENPSPTAKNFRKKEQERLAEEERRKEQEAIAEDTTEKVFDVVEQSPEFPGGNEALFKYLSSNVKYLVMAQEKGLQGRVIVQFVVRKDGSISDIQVVRSIDLALDNEAIRVITQMPKWIPGKQGGNAVNVKYILPVSFFLQGK